MFFFVWGVASWLSKLQIVVALSIIEANTTTQTCKEVIWIQRLLKELWQKQQKIIVYCDGQSVLHIAKNPIFNFSTEQRGVQFHFVQVVKEGSVNMKKINTKNNLADVFFSKARIY